MANLRDRLLEAEADILEEALQRSHGVQSVAAESLGITARSMYYRVRRMRGRPEYVAGRRPKALGLRFTIFRRDGFRCAYCGQSPTDGIILQMDHVIPVSQGGSNAAGNLITACSSCNQGKRDARGLTLASNRAIVESAALLA